jgi:hypothetical protein
VDYVEIGYIDNVVSEVAVQRRGARNICGNLWSDEANLARRMGAASDINP